MTALTNNFNASLARLKKQIQASRLLKWWLGELSTMVPVWMRSSELTREHYVLVALDQISAKMAKPEVASPRVAAITLSANQALRKTITLPLATEENLRQVLEFQMEQHTPFAANQLYFGYSVLSRDFAAGELKLEFVAAPREAIDAATKTLLVLGVDVRAVFPDEQLSAGRLLNLLPAARGNAPSPLRHGANPWLAALVALLMLAALVAPLVIKREAVVQMLPLVDKGKKGAELVTAVRRDIDDRVKQHNFLLEKRQMSPPVIQILEELTRILPDDTWLSSIELKDRKLQIQGESASASQLISLFEKSTIFSDASFGSDAIFKGQAPNTQRFKLTIQLRAPAKPASATSAPSAVPAVPASAVSAVKAALAANLANPASAAQVASAVAASMATTPVASSSQPASGVKKP